MCYLAVYPPGVMPDYGHLVNAAGLNRDGYGWSVGLDEVYHTLLNGPVAVSRFTAARAQRMGEPAIFHARHATSGTPVTLANCQPLVLDDGSIVAHNGALFDVGGPESDTRVFAEKFLPKWDLGDAGDRRELAGLVHPNKFVILRPGKPPVMLNDRLGIWLEDGSWHSNSDFTGLDHKRAGVCAACGVPLRDGETAGVGPEVCRLCLTRHALRWNRLAEAR